LAVLLLAAACKVDTTVTVTVHDDGSGVVGVTAVLDPDAVKAAESGGGKLEDRVRLGDLTDAGWTVHPGEILREEFLEPMNISAYRLAMELHVSPPTVNDIVREKRGITPEMAARLARYFGTSEQFWLNLQDTFAVHHVKEKYSKELKAIKPVAAAAVVR